jgi:uncharacterized protein YxjI
VTSLGSGDAAATVRGMQYPLALSFKILALAPEIQVRDAAGRVLMHVRQKMFRLKESVTVFADERQQTVLAKIDADRVLDFNAAYRFTGADGAFLGAVQRRGARSLWRATYEIQGPGGSTFDLHETNPMAKVGDGLFGGIPIVGALSGFVFHPRYSIDRPSGETVLRVRKEAALLEGRFSIERVGDMDADDERAALLATLMMLLLERARG